MKIGIPAEVRPRETRVAATPETVKKLAAGGLHQIILQSGAGLGASVTDEAYTQAGPRSRVPRPTYMGRPSYCSKSARRRQPSCPC